MNKDAQTCAYLWKTAQTWNMVMYRGSETYYKIILSLRTWVPRAKSNLLPIFMEGTHAYPFKQD